MVNINSSKDINVKLKLIILFPAMKLIGKDK